MNIYILSKKGFEFQELLSSDLERKLSLLNILIKAFIKFPEDLETFGELYHERTKLEFELNFLLHPLPDACGDCISPEWEEIGVIEKNQKSTHDLKLELEILKRKSSIKASRPIMRQKRERSKVSILEVLEKAGIKPKNSFIHCVFHAERNPSLRIYPETNTCFCFGCGRFATADELARALGVEL